MDTNHDSRFRPEFRGQSLSSWPPDNIELDHMHSSNGRMASASPERRSRNRNDHLEVPASIVNATDRELENSAETFARFDLELEPNETKRFIRAARVAKDYQIYELIAREEFDSSDRPLHVQLNDEEKKALVKEKDRLFSEKNILIVNITVAIAAFLQGHVQSSINGGTPFPFELGIVNKTLVPTELLNDHGNYDGRFCITSNLTSNYTPNDNLWKTWRWELGAVNAVPWFAAALIGCWLSLPINDRLGRKGGMMVAAVLVFISSLASGLCLLITAEEARWKVLTGVRVVNGIGMGLKAVSTTILASETAIRFWRGSFVLGWQLWVAFGIMSGFVINLIFVSAIREDHSTVTVALILGAPAVPAFVLFCILPFCPESPRYYMRRDSPRYNPKKAYEIMVQLRDCELLAMKDMFILHKTIEEEYRHLGWDRQPDQGRPSRGRQAPGFFGKFGNLFTTPRLRNAVISSGTVNLAQQLCGINLLAFYSGWFFIEMRSEKCDYEHMKQAMGLSLGFGATNFVFGLPAFRTIDSLGRRKWLIATLPLMCIFMLLAAVSFPLGSGERGQLNDIKEAALNATRTGIDSPGQQPSIQPLGPYGFVPNLTIRTVAMFLYLHAAVYSPGLGPIPFTLASESFPLSHRELGCALSVAICYGFAGVLSLTFPSIVERLQPAGSLALFAGLTALAALLVFLFVEETKELSLESLDEIFKLPKTRFVKYQVFEYLPWWFKRYIVRQIPAPEKPNLEYYPRDSDAYDDPQTGGNGTGRQREPSPPPPPPPMRGPGPGPGLGPNIVPSATTTSTRTSISDDSFVGNFGPEFPPPRL